MSHQPRFYAASNFLKMGIKYLNLSSFGQFRQYRTKSLLQMFHYIKTVSGKVVAQSIAFRVVSIYWQGVVPLPICWYHSKGNWMLYNFAADSFYIMKHCSRLFVLHCRSRPKYDRSRHFDPHFEEVWGRRRTLVDGSLESPCWVLVKRNWTSFSISYGWGATRQNVSKLAAFRSG